IFATSNHNRNCCFDRARCERRREPNASEQSVSSVRQLQLPEIPTDPGRTPCQKWPHGALPQMRLSLPTLPKLTGSGEVSPLGRTLSSSTQDRIAYRSKSVIQPCGGYGPTFISHIRWIHRLSGQGLHATTASMERISETRESAATDVSSSCRA